MIELQPGAVVRITSPVLPGIHQAPDDSSVVLLPVSGPQGPPGLPGGDIETVQGLIDDSIAAHVQAVEPHPAYDLDIPSLSILFENGLV